IKHTIWTQHALIRGCSTHASPPTKHPSGATLPALTQVVVRQDERHHGFHHGHSAWQYTRIMTALGFENSRFPLIGDCFLRLRNRGGRLKSDAHEQWLTNGDAALDTSRVIGPRVHLPIAHFVGIIVLAASERCASKARTNLKPFRRWQGHQRLSEVGLEL